MSVLVLFNELKFSFAFEGLIGHGCSPPLKEWGWTAGGKGAKWCILESAYLWESDLGLLTLKNDRTFWVSIVSIMKPTLSLNHDSFWFSVKWLNFWALGVGDIGLNENWVTCLVWYFSGAHWRSHCVLNEVGFCILRCSFINTLSWVFKSSEVVGSLSRHGLHSAACSFWWQLSGCAHGLDHIPGRVGWSALTSCDEGFVYRKEHQGRGVPPPQAWVCSSKAGRGWLHWFMQRKRTAFEFFEKF